MTTRIIAGLLLCVLLTGGAPRLASAQSDAVDSLYRTTLLQLIAALQQQIVALQAELAQRQSAERAALRPADATPPNFPYTILSEYDVTPQTTELRTADKSRKAFFNRILELTPVQYRASLAGFVVYDGGRRTSDAYVTGKKYSTGYFEWYFGVSDELLGERFSYAVNDELIVHELGHIVALEAALDPGEVYECHEAVGAGGNCPNPSSMYAQFIDEFWSEELLDELDGGGADFRGVEMRGYETHFVSDYASANPAEDFAETFMMYVLDVAPDYDTSITRKKITWLSQSVDLQQIRREILNSI